MIITTTIHLCRTKFHKVDCTINMHCMLLPILFTLCFRYPDMIQISKWHSIFIIDPEIALSLYELQVLSLQSILKVSKHFDNRRLYGALKFSSCNDDKSKKGPTIKTPHFLSNPHETWSFSANFMR